MLVSLPLVGGGFTEGGVFVEEGVETEGGVFVEEGVETGVGAATGTKTASYNYEWI